MAERRSLDGRDRAILTMFSRDPGVSQEAIAREVGLRQPSVAVRVRKLREGGYLEVQAGIDPFAVGLQMAKVDVRATNPSRILSMFSGCPYFMNGMVVSGRSNLCLFFVAERISTLEAIVDHHLRNIPGVQDVDFNIVISPAKKIVMPVRFTRSVATPVPPASRGGRRAPGGGAARPAAPGATVEKEGAPCGEKEPCRECAEREGERCAGCPVAVKIADWFF
ncbi:MAG: Lrp/AsnC family transcriptional regulator [Thermoplasmata archaeon]